MANTQVYYIHGYGSSVNSETLSMLRESYPDAIGLTYDHNYPYESIVALAKTINDKSLTDSTYPVIVGSSLGGWYTEQLTNLVVGGFIMYNPSTRPEVTIARHGVPQAILLKYKQISFSHTYLSASRTVLLSEDDEIIDHAVAMIKYKNISHVMMTSGGHRMCDANMRLIVDKIKFLENQM